MSPFISHILSAGLIEMPPVSNVTPLPTKARWPFGFLRPVGKPDQSRRIEAAAADLEQPVVAFLLELLFVPDLDVEIRLPSRSCARLAARYSGVATEPGSLIMSRASLTASDTIVYAIR